MIGKAMRAIYERTYSRGVGHAKRSGSNQQELLEEVEPHRRPGGRFVGALRVVLHDELHVADVRLDRGKIEWQVRHLRIDLRLLHGQIVARALAMIFARAVRMAVVFIADVIAIAIGRLFELRLLAATINVRVVPAAADRCVNEQRSGNQTG
jgi:hypothetical protein